MAYLKSIFLLFTLLSATLTLAANGTVPSLEKQFEIKYFGKATWFNAHLSCLACGGQLASIESQAEQNRVEGQIRDLGLQNSSFWIAGTDLANEGIFNWFTTGNLIEYSNFREGQPDNGSGTEREHCLELRGVYEQQWNDLACHNLLYFICENRPICKV